MAQSAERGASAQVRQGLSRTRGAWFGRVARLFTEPKVDPALWDELEGALIGADVGLDLSEDLVARTRERVRRDGLDRRGGVKEALALEIAETLRASAKEPEVPLQGPAAPEVVLVVGVNGSGKTTSIAKLARREMAAGRSVLLAAADTFRAAAIEQLRHWGGRLGVDVIAHRHGADPGAVVFDGIQAAKARAVDAVIIDTAGRLHTKSNLMEELRKVCRVIDRAAPDAPVRVVLVLDATTGQNGLSQAREFMATVGVTEIVLSKLDGTSKGGIALAIADGLRVPIAYIGTGEGIDDLVDFEPAAFANALVE